MSFTTVAGAVRFAHDAIRGAGVGDTAKLDAELLVGSVLDMDRVQLRVRDDQPVDDEGAERVRELTKRRVAGAPIAYLLGTAWFYGREFMVDERVLVPRPETELLIELALAHVRDGDTGAGADARVLDVGTGSGCIAVTVAAELPGAVVHAADISTDAIAVATQNAARHGVHVTFHDSDLLEAAPGDLDIVLSNPPYVDGIDAEGLEPGVRDHEPHVALFVPSGEEVGAFYGRLATQAVERLRPGGLLAVEHGYGQRELVRAAFERAGFVDVAGHDDLAGIDRVVTGRAPQGEGT